MKKIFATTMFALATLAASAQTQESFSPYGFVQVQGGVSTTFTNVNQKDILSPTATINVGAMVIPQLGLRLGVNGWEQKGAFASLDNSTYKYNYINADVDLLLNVTNLFRKNYNSLFDLYLVGGIGINHAWNNNISDLPLSQVQEDVSNAWGNDLAQTTYHGTSFRMGALADFKLCKHWSLGAEVDMNAMGDDWNAKFQRNRRDWQLTAQISLTYKFGGKKRAKKVVEPVAPVEVVSIPQEVVREKIIEKEVIKESPVNEALQYALRGSDVNNQIVINKVAEWCKNHPNQKIYVDGYADRGTGNPKINMKYSQKRTDKVVAALKAAGVSEGMIVANAHGDTEQPFAENELNRCVIISSK